MTISKIGLALLFASAVAGCDDRIESVATNDTSQNALEEADAAINSAMAMLNGGQSDEAKISSADLARVCRAAIARVMGKELSIMKVKGNSGGIVRIQYTRPDDGTIWKDDCRVEGQQVIWRAVDATPGSGAGRWRTMPDDGVLTYSISGDDVTINERYSDGSTDASIFTISR